MLDDLVGSKRRPALFGCARLDGYYGLPVGYLTGQILEVVQDRLGKH